MKQKYKQLAQLIRAPVSVFGVNFGLLTFEISLLMYMNCPGSHCSL